MYKIIQPKDFKKPLRKVTFVVVHCTAADNEGTKFEGTALVETVNVWHKQRGFAEVGYHYIIDKKGQIMTARDVEKIPAAQVGKNTGSIAICCHGLLKEKFTIFQEIALRNLCEAINAAYNNTLTFHGHCEFANKTCPVYDYRKWLNLDAKGNMKSPSPLEISKCANTSPSSQDLSSQSSSTSTQPSLPSLSETPQLPPTPLSPVFLEPLTSDPFSKTSSASSSPLSRVLSWLASIGFSKKSD